MKGQTRREFLSRGFSGVALAGASFTLLRPVASLASKLQQPPAVASRGYTAGKFALEIDGQFAGWLQSVEGGRAVSDVVMERAGSGGFPAKHIGGVKYEDIVVNCTTGMSAGYYDWIKASLAAQTIRKNGSVVAYDYNFKEQSRMEWSNAAITEIGFPACDAASKDAAKITVKVAPEMTRTLAGSGTANASYKTGVMKSKPWLSANFRLQIDGLDCSRVNKIEAITAKTAFAANRLRALPGQALGKPQEQISNIVLTLPEAYAEGFYKWHQAFVVEGKNGPAGEKSGKLDYLASPNNAALFALTFQHLGIFKLTPVALEADAVAIRRVQVEMYCKSLGFEWTGAALA